MNRVINFLCVYSVNYKGTQTSDIYHFTK